ncbi:MAG: helix-turn-helix domain-containing protein [Bacteroidota bacterium]
MSGSGSMDQVFIRKLTEIVLAHISDEGFGVEKLAEEAGMNRATLYRKLKSNKNQSISKFISEVRLQQAMEMLRNKQGTAAEISYRVGFGSPAYFNKCFHEYYGFPPGEVKKRGAGVLQDKMANEPAILSDQWHGIRQTKYRHALIIFAAILTGFVLIWSFSDLFQKNRDKKSIIVLPFKNLSPEQDNEYFADGIMEDILDHLFHISKLSVRSRTTSEHLRNQSLSMREIARQVNARYVLEGSVRQFENRVRITVQLIDGQKDHHMWSESFDREFTDIIGVQSDIALQVAHQLNTALTENEISQIQKVPTRSSEAYDAYLRGRFLLNRADAEQRADFDKEGLLGSIQYFNKAIAADKRFAEAYAGLANAYFNITAWGLLPPQEGGFQKAGELSMKALEIDPGCAEAHAVKGALHIWGERRFEEGGKELRNAIQFNSNFSPAHQWYAQLLMITGPIAEARIHMDHALEIEPYYWVLHNLDAWIYYFEEKYDKAVDACHLARELKSDYITTNWLFFLNYAKLGEGEKAAKELQTIVRADPITSQYAGEVMDIYYKSGIEGLFAWLIDLNINKPGQHQGINGQPYYIAWWNALLGNKEESIYWLNRNMEARYKAYHYFNLIALNPDFDLLRSDPRFLAIIDQIGLTTYHTRTAK